VDYQNTHFAASGIDDQGMSSGGLDHHAGHARVFISMPQELATAPPACSMDKNPKA